TSFSTTPRGERCSSHGRARWSLNSCGGTAVRGTLRSSVTPEDIYMAELPDFDPEFEVWNHLEGGLQQARDELRALDRPLRKAVEALGAAIAGTRGLLILPASKADLLRAEGSL